MTLLPFNMKGVRASGLKLKQQLAWRLKRSQRLNQSRCQIPLLLIRLGENDTENQLNLVTPPLEVFNHQVGLFGWNVIKEASKLNEVLASKVISFVDQLIESGEWHFAPG